MKTENALLLGLAGLGILMAIQSAPTPSSGSDPARSGGASGGSDPNRGGSGGGSSGTGGSGGSGSGDGGNPNQLPSWEGWMGFYQGEPSGPLLQEGEGRLAADRKAAEANADFEVVRVRVVKLRG